MGNGDSNGLIRTANQKRSEFESVAHLTEYMGRIIGHSEWHEISQQLIDDFAAVTGDHQWIHTDPHLAAAGPYGATIAHGYLTLSMIPVMAKEAFLIKDSHMGINYGSNRVRFPQAVPVGSKIRAEVRLASAEPTQHGVRITTIYTIVSDQNDRPVCVAEIVSLISS